MASTRGRCINFDFCSVAESRRDIEVRAGQDFVCPECGKPLRAPRVRPPPRSPVMPALLGLGVLVLAGGAVLLGMRIGGAPGVADAPPPGAENVLARVHGDAGLAGRLVAPLAAAYLAQAGDDAVTTTADEHQTKVSGLRGTARECIVIMGDGVGAGMAALAAGQADLVVSPRRISAAEQGSPPAAEHVLAGPVAPGVYLYSSPKTQAGFARRWIAYMASPQGAALPGLHGLVLPALRPGGR